MKLEDRKRLYKLIEEWTRAECMARHAPLGWPDCGDYFFEARKRETEIRELMFGTGDLVELSQRWGLPIFRIRRGKKHKKHRGTKR